MLLLQTGNTSKHLFDMLKRMSLTSNKNNINYEHVYWYGPGTFTDKIPVRRLNTICIKKRKISFAHVLPSLFWISMENIKFHY